MGSDIQYFNFKLNRFLTPLAFLYGMAVRCRNRLFDWGILPSETYDIPVICVGNLAVGGTGKTPHIEYLIRHLRYSYRVAVLSRGYKRESKGFVLARPGITSREIGDEPYQMWRKYPSVTVAVDANRRRGIRLLLELPETGRPEVILLDDAFQHRYVKPTFSIVLTDFHRPYFADKLLPVGRLREPIKGAKRANVVIITNTDRDTTVDEYFYYFKELNLEAFQRHYFSHVVYNRLEPVFPDEAPVRLLSDLDEDREVLAISGIAHPEYFLAEIRKHSDLVTPMIFPDHHAFGEEDFQKIQAAFDLLTSPEKMMIVTEKDAARLRDHPLLPEAWHGYLYQLPITIGFLGQEYRQFNQQIDDHIKYIKKQSINTFRTL